MKEVIIYTDGACRGNPGHGGWGVLMQYHNENNSRTWRIKRTLSGKTLY